MVADLVEKAEEEKESEEVKEKNGEAEEEEVAPPVESEEAPLTQDSKMKKTPVKAADLAEDWNEEGEEENGEKPEKAAEKIAEDKSEKMAEAEVDTTPVRKSGRAPKPTEKLLEGKQQEKMKPVEDEEESVDAIAAELEKSDPEVKKAGVKSPKKGSAKKVPKKEGDKEEDWVSLIFGENGEKVTIQKGPVRGISLKLQEEERERRMDYVPDRSEVDTEAIQVDPDTRDMLKELDMDKLPNITTTNIPLGRARR